MAYLVRRVVNIGLGGTGLAALLHAKRALTRVYGEVPPSVSFLSMDTTEPTTLGAGSDEVNFSRGEFLKLTVNNPNVLVRENEEVRDWFPDNIPAQVVHNGAGGIRALGRLSLFANAPAVYSALQNTTDQVRRYGVGTAASEKFRVPENSGIIVNIVGSIAGGTGSGTFLDIATITRSLLHGGTDRIFGYLLLPDVFANRPATDNVEPNAYGALLELDHSFDLEAGESSGFKFGGQKISITVPPFDLVYLTNNMNAAGVHFPNVEDLCELLGMGLFLSVGSSGQGFDDRWVNFSANLSTAGDWNGKRPHYASFGVSELIYDREQNTELAAKKLILELVTKTFQGSEPVLPGEVDLFLESNGLQEIGDDDDVIDSVAPPGDFRTISPPELTKDDVRRFLAGREAHLGDAKREIYERAQDTVEKVKEAKKRVVDKYVRENIDEPQGLERTRSFIRSLKGVFQEARAEMENERKANNKDLKDTMEKTDSIGTECEDALGRFFNFRGAVDSPVAHMVSAMNKITELEFEVRRREGASEIFSALIEVIVDWAQKIERLDQNMLSLVESLNQEVHRLGRTGGGQRPFTIVLPPRASAEDGSASPTDFLAWIKSKGTSVADLAGMQANEIREFFLEYAYEQDEIRKMEECQIEQALSELTVEDRRRYITDLDRKAVPMWQYDRGYIGGTRKTVTFSLFGVNEKDQTVFNDEEMAQVRTGSQQVETVSTSDETRVLCLKAEASLPAFVIKDIRGYKQKYDQRTPSLFHTQKSYVGLSDLIPDDGSANNRRYWSLALSDTFGLVKRTGQYYQVKSVQSGRVVDDHMVRLAQGRAESLRSFLGDRDLIAEIKQEIEQRTKDLGIDQTVKSLREYSETHAAKASNATDEIKDQIEGELNDIQSYIQELTSL